LHSDEQNKEEKLIYEAIIAKMQLLHPLSNMIISIEITTFGHPLDKKGNSSLCKKTPHILLR
jgi:hypothetical protein